MDPVEFDLQVRDAGARPFPGLECEQELTTVVLDVPQVVELGIETRCDHAAVPECDRRFQCHCTGQQVEHRMRCPYVVGQRAQQFGLRVKQGRGQVRQARETVAQRGQIARPGAAQRNAAADALDVRDAAQRGAHRAEARAVAVTDELGDDRMPGRGRTAVAKGVMQRMPQPARPHAGDAMVEQREQGRRGLAPQCFGQLQVAPCGCIHAQERALALDPQRRDVVQTLTLRAARVIEQRGRGGGRDTESFGPEAGQVACAKMLGQQALSGFPVELPVREPSEYRGQRFEQRQGQAVRDQHFGGAQPLELVLQLLGGALHQRQVAIGEIQPRQPELSPMQRRGQQQCVTPLIQQRGIGECAGCHDAADRTLHRAFGRTRFADLLGDDGRLAELDQLGEVGLERVKGDTGHLDRPAGRLAPRRQRDVEQPGGLLRVVEEELVEVSHAVEEQRVRVLRLEHQILLHHRGVAGHCVRHGHGIHMVALWQAHGPALIHVDAGSGAVPGPRG